MADCGGVQSGIDSAKKNLQVWLDYVGDDLACSSEELLLGWSPGRGQEWLSNIVSLRSAEGKVTGGPPLRAHLQNRER